MAGKVEIYFKQVYLLLWLPLLILSNSAPNMWSSDIWLNGGSPNGFQSATSADKDRLSGPTGWLTSVLDADDPGGAKGSLFNSPVCIVGESQFLGFIDDSYGAKNWDVSLA